MIGGTKVETETANPPPQPLAIGLIKTAIAYVEAAQLLDKAQVRSTKVFHPKYFLLCQSMELALKAYLAASGVSQKKLRSRVGHNIELAFQYAQRRFGFTAADARFPELVGWLAPYHLDHSFRYRKTQKFQLPPASEAAEIINNTAAEIEVHVRREFSNL